MLLSGAMMPTMS
ncbi:hypothetical protein KKH27_06965 [bacterium]|nr:hypothetical protein [bacterium]MBU1983468.1 hypothetical protein [bacterium]